MNRAGVNGVADDAHSDAFRLFVVLAFFYALPAISVAVHLPSSTRKGTIFFRFCYLLFIMVRYQDETTL